jgi:hypothetical protein
MSKRQILILLGIASIFFLFVGIPSFWDKCIAVVIGALIVFVSYSLKPEPDPRGNRPVPYVEYKAAFKTPRPAPVQPVAPVPEIDTAVTPEKEPVPETPSETIISDIKETA